MNQMLLISLGGIFGSLARYGLGIIFSERFPGHFPVGTLTVNALGSFCIGICYVLITEKSALHSSWYYILMVGFLGAFTTFSTFSLDAVNLMLNDQQWMAIGYISASVLVCISGTVVAIMLTRLFI